MTMKKKAKQNLKAFAPGKKNDAKQKHCSICGKRLPKNKRNTMGARIGIQTCSFECSQTLTIQTGMC